ncbi:MAG: iron-containing alcohol dehydrogenase [Proteobacteria bacterium]|nr:iron-containing alcohol dehydrogenase [Pseudomonadota bacterium]
MQNFIFENPTKIIFGKGTISRIGREVKRFGSKVLLVYGQESIKKNGIYEQVTESLREADISIVELPGVKSNPVLSLALKGIELARKEKVDTVLAVGGGSVIDTAKTVAAGVKADHDVWDFFTYKKTIKDALPVLTVLTISASASEMNPVAVITKEESDQKYSIRSPFIQPKTSILDPTVLYTLSPEYSAYSAVDAMTHALEGYFNNSETDSPLQDRLVEAFIRTIIENTEIILKNPTDYNARANMMWSATLAFNGLTTAGMGMVSYPAHMIEHSLSALYDIAHGAGLSIVLPGWMSYTLEKNPKKFARLAREIFDVKEIDDEEAAAEGVKLLKSWFAGIGSPTSLLEGDIPESDIEKIAENAVELARIWGLKEYTKDVIVDILNLCR